MRRYGFQLGLLLLFLAGLVAGYIAWGDLLTFEVVRKHRDALQLCVERHYLFSIALFSLVLISTAFLVPGALVLSILSGFLFGVVRAVILVDVVMTIGAALAFLSSRYFLGNSIQKRFGSQLAAFNREMEKHGPNYLFVLRIVPALPFFLVNYMAGLTRMSLGKFVSATSIGILPGAFVYSYAGQQMATIRTVEEILSPRIVTAFLALSFFAILPAIIRHWRHFRSSR